MWEGAARRQLVQHCVGLTVYQGYAHMLYGGEWEGRALTRACLVRAADFLALR